MPLLASTVDHLLRQIARPHNDRQSENSAASIHTLYKYLQSTIEPKFSSRSGIIIGRI